MRGEIISEERIAGKRSVGRGQNFWLEDLRRWLECSSLDILRKAVSEIQTTLWMATSERKKRQEGEEYYYSF